MVRTGLKGTGWLLVTLLSHPTWAVDTGQVACYGDRSEISCPTAGEPFYGQDGNYQGAQPSYQDNAEGTVTDRVTGLVWSKAVDRRKVSLVGAKQIARQMDLGGYRDWRVPTIKELYTLIDFRGYTGFSGSRSMSRVPANATPFINTDYFDFAYGDTASGERYIDAQWLSSTEYVHTTMHGDQTLFGVNFADGRIKGYGYRRPSGKEKRFYARYVRGAPYGENQFQVHDDGTITDQSSGLMWAQRDSGKGMSWKQALAYAESSTYAGHTDWRLPNAKEIQYLVDYSRAPDVTRSAAIDPSFHTTSITNEGGQKDYPYFWSSTTHLDGPNPGKQAAYIAFGRALGKMRGRVMDVHGAGAQRSDPKVGQSQFRGPQGDAVRASNFVRLVRGGSVHAASVEQSSDPNRYPNKVLSSTQHAPQGISQRPSRRSNSPQRGQFIQRLDRNGDGRVSRSEFDGPANRFDVHDKNGDGYLSATEAPKAPPQRRRRPPR